MVTIKKISFLHLLFFAFLHLPLGAKSCFTRTTVREKGRSKTKSTFVYNVHPSDKTCAINSPKNHAQLIKIQNNMNEKVYIRITSRREYDAEAVQLPANQTAELYVRREFAPDNFTGLVIHDDNSHKRNLAPARHAQQNSAIPQPVNVTINNDKITVR